MRDWLEEAACRGADPSLWFPGRGSGGEVYAAARAICDVCPVRDECLNVALAEPQASDVGIWAGTTPDERRDLRRDGITWNA